MATLVKTPSGTWKAVIRKAGWPTVSKTFRIKRNAEDWARRTEDEMVRGIYVQRSAAERMTVEAALERYLREVTPGKRPSSQRTEKLRAKVLVKHLGRYSLAALTPGVIAQFRDDRLAGDVGPDGKRRPRKNNTVRLELALLGHLFTVALKEWGLGLTYNPVQSIRRPPPGPGRDRRLSPEETKRLLEAVDPETGHYSSSGAIRLLDVGGAEAMVWSFAKLMDHWKAKHAHAAFVPSQPRKAPERQYRYGNNVLLGEGAEFGLFLRAVHEGKLYYDPGIKLENASTAKPKAKKRSQFRIGSKNLPALYESSRIVDACAIASGT